MTAHDLKPATAITVLLEGREIHLKGRFAWALDVLIRRGEKGTTSMEHAGARLSHYVLVIRRTGIVIETKDERNTRGVFGGHYGRYILRSPLTVLKVVRAGEEVGRDAA